MTDTMGPVERLLRRTCELMVERPTMHWARCWGMAEIELFGVVTFLPADDVFGYISKEWNQDKGTLPDIFSEAIEAASILEREGRL